MARLEVNSLDDPLECILLADSPSDDEDEEYLALLEGKTKGFTQEVPLESLELLSWEYTQPKVLIEEPAELELKTLPPYLKYDYLGLSPTLLIMISVEFTKNQEEESLVVLEKHKKGKQAYKNEEFGTRVPNTLNVITNFPFLIVGVLGFVLCLGGGSFFNIRLPGVLWDWLLFYGGTASVAFGSAYYHLRPDDNRVLLDTLPMVIAYSSLFSTFILERLGERIGLSCLFSLVVLAVLSTSYARFDSFLR
ncbi:uncharacterized protein [Gossypium hirsutum]|uniref:Uncharacterized protein n=1 Tax=Gossypium hirsutum TaxID=3635 RepID=A0A1U8ITC6_GOSHI|nr:uncharacterized protein LOC107900132 [Gossypium hirsutum]